jgi:hypothetical protein
VSVSAPPKPVKRRRFPARASGKRFCRLGSLAVLAALFACAPIVRPPTFRGARDHVTGSDLTGPFDGQIVDELTGEPIPEAVVVGVWSFDTGDGFIGPGGSHTAQVRTDAAGRYRIPALRRLPRGSRLRLVAFNLFVYKRGYVGYRSDADLAGGRRRDFTVRHNRIALEKWNDRFSHAEHLVYLAAPPDVSRAARWERQLANRDLYEQLGGAIAPTGDVGAVTPDVEPADENTLLDASTMLSIDDVRARTGAEGEFDLRELGGLPRTAWYHGVHLQARDRGEEYDVAYRVWHAVPGGLDVVRETLNATLPGVAATAEVTQETYVFEDERVRAVGFVDAASQTAVLLTCGASVCADLDTALILAKFLHGRIDAIGSIPATQRGDGAPVFPGPGEPLPRRVAPEPSTEPDLVRPGDEEPGEEEPATDDAEEEAAR